MGSLTLKASPVSPVGSAPRNTKTFWLTLTTHSPHGKSSCAPGKPSAKARSAALAAPPGVSGPSDGVAVVGMAAPPERNDADHYLRSALLHCRTNRWKGCAPCFRLS